MTANRYYNKCEGTFMDRTVENDAITRSDPSLRVISSANAGQSVKAKSRTKRRPFRQIRTETVFKRTLVAMGIILVILILGILLTLIVQSLPSIKALGPKYLWGKVWDPVQDVYGAWPFLLGTLLSSFLALLISIPFSMAVAIFLGRNHYPKGWLPNLLKKPRSS